ncbi:hypothetical protein Bpro_0039 [Polaromonas sp. JS666]|nr:hypothetical protein Bpro_0039 [Polaromonas sp. JS666]
MPQLPSSYRCDHVDAVTVLQGAFGPLRPRHKGVVDRTGESALQRVALRQQQRLQRGRLGGHAFAVQRNFKRVHNRHAGLSSS